MGEGARKKGKKTKKFYIVIFVSFLLLLCAVGSGGMVVGYRVYTAKYHNDMSLAQVGEQHLRTAITLLETLPQHPFDDHSVSQAQHEFTTALTSFVQLDNDLKSLPGISASIPTYGVRLSAALRLVPLATEVSQAGIAGCAILNLLISRFHDPLSAQGHGLTLPDLTVIDNYFSQIKATLNLVSNQVNHLQPTDLEFDPRIEKIVTVFHNNLPALRDWLDKVEKLLPVVPTLLGIGTPTNYLIEILDSTELRPGGGFIGNYGIAALEGGRLTAAHITDTYLLDDAFLNTGHSIPYPSAYRWFDLAPASWSLRDSNLDADFPTVAQYSELNYKREGGNIPVVGVIAITPALISQALTITGPINVPEYHETVTAQNLVDRIHYYQVGLGYEGNDIPSPDGRSSVRKHFTALLAEHFLARIRQISSSALSRLFQLLISSIRSKDLQIYLNSKVAEDLLQSSQFGSTIQSPIDDSLFVVDANISPGKTNGLITNTLNDQVTIDVNGNALHHTTISYAWTNKGPTYGSSTYRDYLRVYVPPSSILQVQQGWQPYGTSKAFGREVWAGLFTLSYGQTHTITLVWLELGAARKDATVWHYQYVIQRQAGAQWTLHLQVTLPLCGVMTNKWGGLVSKSGQAAMLAQPLNEDLNVGIDYTCQRASG